MGLLSLTSAGFGNSLNISGIQSAGGMWMYARVKIDALRNIASTFSAALFQVDDGTTPNRKFGAIMSNNSNTYAVSYRVPGALFMQTGFLPLTSLSAAGRFMVFYGWFFNTPSFDHGVALYDDTGTNTLMDGLPTSTSLAWRTNNGNLGPLPTVAGSGIVHLNSCAEGSTGPLVIDCLAFGTTKRVAGTEDSMPTAGADGCNGLWYFDDTPGSSVAAFTTVCLNLAITAGQGTFSTGGTMLPGGAPSVATAVVVTPPTASIAIAGTTTRTVVTNDQFGNPMAGRTRVWTSSAPSIATVNSSTGLITGVAVGTATITAADSPAASDTIVITVTATVGAYTYASSATPVASVTSPGGLVTDTGTTTGQATITVTRTGSGLTVTLVVNGVATVGGGGGGPGGGGGTGTHEPAGMTAVVNTGPITVNPPGSGQTVTLGSGATAWSVTNFSPATTDSLGQNAANLSKEPSRSGWRINYTNLVHGGNSPVRFGGSHASRTIGNRYQQWLVWFSPGFTGPLGNGTKMSEPQMRNQGGGPGNLAGSNHILMNYPAGGVFTQLSPMTGLQGVNKPSRNLIVNQGHPAIMSDGAVHIYELLYTQESPPGASTGGYDCWLDNVLVAHYTDVTWLAVGGVPGWVYMFFDPTLGGAPDSYRTAPQYYGFDRLYISVN